jgi:hypothetical protein
MINFEEAAINNILHEITSLITSMVKYEKDIKDEDTKERIQSYLLKFSYIRTELLESICEEENEGKSS